MNVFLFIINLFFKIIKYLFQIIWWIYCLPFRLLDLLLPFPDHGLFHKSEISGYEFEEYCAHWLKKHGYRRCLVTKGSGDQGVDVIAYKNRHKYAIQCKYYADKVGNKAVQEVYAGMTYHNCDKAIVMTNSTFTPSAEELARKTEVLLIDRIHYRPPASVRVNCMAVSSIMFVVVGILLYFYIGLN